MTQDRAAEIADMIVGDLEDPDPSYANKDINHYQDLLEQNKMLRTMRAQIIAALAAAREESRREGIEAAAREAAIWQGLKGRVIAEKIRALADKEPT